MTSLHTRICLLCLLCVCASLAFAEITTDEDAFTTLYRNIPRCERAQGVDPECLISQYAEWGFLPNPCHAAHGMSGDMPSPRSCRVMRAYQDMATIFCVLARHDLEVWKPCSTVRHKQEILSEEG